MATVNWSKFRLGLPAWISGYLIALFAVIGAVLLRSPLRAFFDDSPFLLLFAAVLVSTAAGGLGPGLAATLLAALGSSVVIQLFPHPQLHMMELPTAWRILLFIGEGIFISVLGAQLKAAVKRAEQSEAEARYLEQKILDVSDEERRRIGQDLHDGLGQHLTGVAFLSKALQRRLSLQSRPEAEDATKIATLVSQSIGQTRALAKGLVPVGLEGGGLHAALTQLATSTSDVFEIQCTCELDEEMPPVDGAVATHLYRIAQEAVNNALRHGRATTIAIALETGKHHVHLGIRDNGIGISPKPEEGGLGLQIMHFRARMIYGNLQVARGADGGTIVTCRAPLPDLEPHLIPGRT